MNEFVRVVYAGANHSSSVGTSECVLAQDQDRMKRKQ